jgi:hypothetical protein
MTRSTVSDSRRQRALATMPVAAVGLVVALAALARMWPPTLVFEEPDYLNRAADPLFAVQPGPLPGYLQILGQLAFVIARPFGDLAPLVTRLEAAAIIGLVAAFVASDALAPAIPNRSVRVLTALSMPLIPTAFPDGFVGPLNDQWWLAIAVLCLALIPARRWHYPAIAFVGLSGMAPCVALPAFRDRRGLVLLAATAVQLGTLLVGHHHDFDFVVGNAYLQVGLLLVASLALAVLPTRTRLAFAYLGLAILMLGSFETQGAAWHQRLFTIAWVGIFLGAYGTLLRARSWLLGMASVRANTHR